MSGWAGVRELGPADLTAVQDLLERAGDYHQLAEGSLPGPGAAAAFFADAPPGCDPARGVRLGLWHRGVLGGVAEVSFGFPAPEDAYLGLLLLAPDLRGQGLGPALLAAAVAQARAGAAPRMYLAVLRDNPRGAAFWRTQGFRATGLQGSTAAGRVLYRLVRDL